MHAGPRNPKWYFLREWRVLANVISGLSGQHMHDVSNTCGEGAHVVADELHPFEDCWESVCIARGKSLLAAAVP